MPRLTFRDYCTRRTLLSVLYEQHDSAFIRLTPAEQRVLHDYYVPSLDLELAELKTHRRVITERQPSLAQRAGRACAQLERLLTTPAAPVSTGRKRRLVRIRVHGVVHPEPDYHKLVRALLDVAREQRKPEGEGGPVQR